MIFKRQNRDASKQGSFVRITSPQLVGDDGGEVGSLDMSSFSTHNVSREEICIKDNSIDGGPVVDFKCNSSISSADKGIVSLSTDIWSTSDVDDLFSKASQEIFNPFGDTASEKTSFFNKNVEDDLRKISSCYISDDDTGRDSENASFFDSFFENDERSRISDVDLDRAFGVDYAKSVDDDSGNFPYFQPDGFVKPNVVSPNRETNSKSSSDLPDDPIEETPESPIHTIDELKESIKAAGHESQVSDFLTTYFDKDTVHTAVQAATRYREENKPDFPCDENEFTFAREMSILSNGSNKSFDESTCSAETQVTSNTDKRAGSSVDEYSQQNLNPYGLRKIYSKSSLQRSDASLAYSTSITNSCKQDSSLTYSTASNDDSSVFSGLISSESFRQKLMFLSHEEGANNPYFIDNKRSKYVIHVNDTHSVQDSHNLKMDNTSIQSKRARHIVSSSATKEESTSICPVDSIQSNFEAFTDMLLDKFQLSVI